MVDMKKKVAIAKHRPIAILLDRSKSTGNIRTDLNRIAEEALEEMKAQAEYRAITEILAIQFDTEPEVTAEFVKLEHISAHALTVAQSQHCTDTGKALLMALEMLDQKKAECREAFEEYYQPICFLITDGNPDPGKGATLEVIRAYEERYARAAAEIKKREKENKLIFVAAGLYVSENQRASMSKLRELSNYPDRIVELNSKSGGLEDLKEFFKIIVNATSSRPDSTPIDALVDNSFGGGKF